MDERAAFEANIDADPLDATNHLVYADWLQDHGHDDEAAFRRAMGEWVSMGHDDYPSYVEPRTFRHYAHTGDYFPEANKEQVSILDRNEPGWAQGLLDQPSTSSRRYYGNYRAMEGDLRNAHRRFLREPRTMSRRSIVTKYEKK